MNIEEVHWYYIDESENDAQLGPFLLKDFKKKFLSGVLSPESYCWHEEIENWDQLKNIHFRGKPALFYFNEQSLLKEPEPIRKEIPTAEPSEPVSNERKLMTIEEEIKERIRKKFAK